MRTNLPTAPQDHCLCGSGQSHAACCRPKPYWYPICPNPGWDGTNFSLMSYESATFHGVNGPALRKRLMEDARLHCAEDRHRRSFWTYWGDPALKASLGIMCFGDFELMSKNPSSQHCTLLVTALSELRLRLLLDFLQETAADLLKTPRLKTDPVTVFDKRTMNQCVMPAPRRN